MRPAERRIATLRREVEALLEPYDAFDVLANLYFLHNPVHQRDFRESQHAGLSIVLEYAATLLLARARQSGTDPDRLPGAGALVGEYDGRLREIAGAVGTLIRFPSRHSNDAWDNVLYNLRIRELNYRNPGFPHQEQATLRELFAPSAIGELRSIVGFSVDSAVHLTYAVAELQMVHMRATARTMDRTARTDIGGKPAALREFWRRPGQYMNFVEADLSSQCGIALSECQAFVNYFALEFGVDRPDPDAIAAGENPIRYRPLLRAEDGRIFLTSVGNLLWAIRPRLELTLKESPRAWERYQRNRKEYTERRSAELLKSILDPDWSSAPLRYASEGRRWESDGLYILDDVAVIAEVKAGGISLKAKQGDVHRLRGDLDDVICEGAEQAVRLQRHIESDKFLAVVGERGELARRDLTELRSIVSVAISLEDNAFLTTMDPDLITRTVGRDWSGQAMPISLYQLEVIADLVEYRAQFIHYLRQRDTVRRSASLIAPEELDLFVHSLEGGLTSTVAWAKRKGVGVRLPSLTDDLHAYVFYMHGTTSAKVPRPRLKLDPAVRRLLDALERQRLPGFVDGVGVLLDMSAGGSRTVPDLLARLRRSVRRGAISHASVVAPGRPRRGLSIAVAHNAGQSSLEAELRAITSSAMDEHGATCWIGVGLAVRSRSPIDAFLHLHS